MKKEDETSESHSDVEPGFQEFVFVREMPNIEVRVNYQSRTVRFVMSKSTMASAGFCGEDFISLQGAFTTMSKKIMLKKSHQSCSSRKFVRIGLSGGSVKYPLIDDFKRLIPANSISCTPRIEFAERGKLCLDFTGITWKKPEPKIPKEATAV